MERPVPPRSQKKAILLMSRTPTGSSITKCTKTINDANLNFKNIFKYNPVIFLGNEVKIKSFGVSIFV